MAGCRRAAALIPRGRIPAESSAQTQTGWDRSRPFVYTAQDAGCRNWFDLGSLAGLSLLWTGSVRLRPNRRSQLSRPAQAPACPEGRLFLRSRGKEGFRAGFAGARAFSPEQKQCRQRWPRGYSRWPALVVVYVARARPRAIKLRGEPQIETSALNHLDPCPYSCRLASRINRCAWPIRMRRLFPPPKKGDKLFRCALQLPSRRVSRNSSSYQLTCAVGLRRQKSARGMSLRSRSPAMVLPQRLLNLVQHLHPFGVGMPFPEHQKTLTANTAMKLSVPVRLPAQHLHVLPLEPFSPKEHPSTFCFRLD